MVRHPRSLVVGGGWDDKFFWHDTVYYVRQSSYDPPEQPLLNREVRGRLGTRPRLATLVQIGSQSTVALQYLVLVEYCRGAAGITGYKFRRRCTAMVWLALTNALTRLDLGHITNFVFLFVQSRPWQYRLPYHSRSSTRTVSLVIRVWK